MDELLVVATAATGGVVGGFIGFVGGMFFADMEMGSLDVLIWMAGGAVIGALVGAAVGAALI